MHKNRQDNCGLSIDILFHGLMNNINNSNYYLNNKIGEKRLLIEMNYTYKLQTNWLRKGWRKE